MKRNILLISGNFYPEPTGIGKYNLEMTEWLADNGYSVHVIATYPYYPHWQVQAPYQRKKRWYYQEQLTTEKGNTIAIYRCPHYVPVNPTGKGRMLLDFTYAFFAFFQVLKFICTKKFDFVMSVVPPLTLGILAVMYKSVRGGKFLYHIQDLQIEAAKELNMIQSPLLIRTLLRGERFILKRANTISSISEAMVNTVRKKTKKHVHFFPNWVDTNTFYPMADKSRLKTEFGFSPSDTIILYSGSIGEKQGLNLVLEVAAKQNNPHIKYVICGSGPYRVALETQAQAMQLKNVVFMPLQQVALFNRFLNMADIHLVIQKSNAGDLVMPSKLTSILAIGGLAVITANEGTCLHHLVDKHNMGILANAENSEALAHALQQATSKASDLVRANALSYAKNNLTMQSVMHKYFAVALQQQIKQAPVIAINRYPSLTKESLNFSTQVK